MWRGDAERGCKEGGRGGKSQALGPDGSGLNSKVSERPPGVETKRTQSPQRSLKKI